MQIAIKSQGIGENTPRKNVSQTHYHQCSLVPLNRFKLWLPQSQAGRAGFQSWAGLAKRSLGRYPTVHNNWEGIMVRLYLPGAVPNWEQVTNFNRYYTWSPNSVDTTLEYVPMLWGERGVGEWTNSINETIRTRNVTHLLGFNE